MALTLRADPDWRDDGHGWSTPPGVDDQANSWDFVAGAAWEPSGDPVSVGVGTGVGTFDIPSFQITQPEDGDSGSGIITLQAIADPPDRLGTALFEPAGEGPFVGVEGPQGVFEYDWSTAAHEGTTIDINASLLTGGAPTGQSRTGVSITGGAAFTIPADNQPVSFTVLLTGVIDFQGGGGGVGSGSATMDLIPPTELVASGLGLGAGEATMILTYEFAGDSLGVGTGTGVFDVAIDLEADGLGLGFGEATITLDDIEFDGAGLGVGTGLGVFDATIEFGAATGLGVGEGLGLLGVIGAPLDFDGDGIGIGTGSADFLVIIDFGNGKGVGVGTGVGIFDLAFADLEGAGLGVGTGTADVAVAVNMAGDGFGVGTGRAAWRTGVYTRAKAVLADESGVPSRVDRSEEFPPKVDIEDDRPSKAKVESNA